VHYYDPPEYVAHRKSVWNLNLRNLQLHLLLITHPHLQLAENIKKPGFAGHGISGPHTPEHKAGSEEVLEGKRIDEILKERLSPAGLLNLSQKLPPELYAKLISAFLRMATLSQLQNPWILPPAEKRKLASELEKIAQELKEVLEGG
jgi:hypothetical protein